MCKTLKGSTTESKISNNTLYANKKVTWSALYRFGKKLSNFEPIFTEGFFSGGWGGGVGLFLQMQIMHVFPPNEFSFGICYRIGL